MQLGDLPAWLAAVGTIAAFVAAFVQIRTERRSRLERERREETDRRYAQARLVAAMPGPEETAEDGGGRSAIDCINSSNEPVYNVVACLVFIQGAAPHTTEELMRLRLLGDGYEGVPVATLTLLPPGTWRAWVDGSGWTSVMAGRPGAEIAFTDRAGVHWIRRTGGQLDEINADPLTYLGELGLVGPHDFRTPEPLDRGRQ